MIKTENLAESKMSDSPWKVICYGQAGAGKTHLMRDFPKPLLLMDFDDKCEPLIGVEGVERATYFAHDASDAPTKWDAFWADIKALKKDTHYKTVVIDSITSLDKVLVRNCVIRGGRAPMARPELQHYMDVKNWYDVLFQTLRSIQDKNIILLAHEDYRIDDDSKVHQIIPLITGSTAKEIASVFKDTWYLEVKNTTNGLQRVLHYQMYKKCVCTSTTLTGVGKIEDPTYAKLLDLRRK